MMKKIFVVLAFLTFWPAAAFAASFTATVDSTSAAVGQPVTLQLTLSGASAKDAPDTSVLTPSFNVVSQGQTTNMRTPGGGFTPVLQLPRSLSDVAAMASAALRCTC